MNSIVKLERLNERLKIVALVITFLCGITILTGVSAERHSLLNTFFTMISSICIGAIVTLIILSFVFKHYIDEVYSQIVNDQILINQQRQEIRTKSNSVDDVHHLHQAIVDIWKGKFNIWTIKELLTLFGQEAGTVLLMIYARGLNPASDENREEIQEIIDKNLENFTKLREELEIPQ